MTQWNKQPEETQFTLEEQAQFLRLVKKLGWQKTGKNLFEAFFSVFPMALCELAVIKEIDTIPHILMWHRDDEHYTGWHMPGGYILRGEKIEETIHRILSREVGLTLQESNFIKYFNSMPENAPIPNHQIALFFLCKAVGDPTQGSYFPLDAIPNDTLKHHKTYITYLQNHEFILAR